jgi:hypothetical protein
MVIRVAVMTSISSAIVAGFASALVGAETTAPVLERLDPPRRAAVVMALLGLVLTGLVLITCVMLGAHWVRRLARHQPRDLATSDVRSEVASARLRKSLEAMLPDMKTGDTVQIDASSKETKVDP